MAIRQVITFKTQPGRGGDFAVGFQPIIDAVLLEPGCEQYELFVSRDGADTMVILERWADIESLEGALKKLYKGPDDPGVAFFKLLEGAPVRERYEVG